MFVRKKANKSGTTTVVVVDKSRGSFHPIKTFGTSSDPKEIEQLFRKALEWILSVDRIDGHTEECRKSDTGRLIVSYL